MSCPDHAAVRRENAHTQKLSSRTASHRSKTSRKLGNDGGHRSSTGARLAEFGAITLPPSFMLRLGSEGSFMVRCWLVWQKENEAGVTFIKSEAPQTA